MKKLLTISLVLALCACTPKSGEQPLVTRGGPWMEGVKFTPPKNIIFMVGDGMGLTQITAGMYLNGNRLNLEAFTYIGLQKTYASDNLVTDSAAGATAFACGVKTYNGAIGVDAKGKPVRNIMEDAELNGMATGIVVTSSIVHATPACFFAHAKNRSYKEEIAADMLNLDLDFFVGGGKKYFDRRDNDQRNLIDELKKKGYNISDYFEKDFDDLSFNFKKNFGYFTADEEPLPRMQGRDYFVPACEAAMTFLSNQEEKGFFLLLESAQIDWGGHANNSDYIISEMIEFDEAVGKVLDFARKDGETLVIVTSDHETGGYAINPGSTMDTLLTAFTTDKHTAVLVPVFAWGPGEELFRGIYENTDLYWKMQRALGFDQNTTAAPTEQKASGK